MLAVEVEISFYFKLVANTCVLGSKRSREGNEIYVSHRQIRKSPQETAIRNKIAVITLLINRKKGSRQRKLTTKEIILETQKQSLLSLTAKQGSLRAKATANLSLGEFSNL